MWSKLHWHQSHCSLTKGRICRCAVLNRRTQTDIWNRRFYILTVWCNCSLLFNSCPGNKHLNSLWKSFCDLMYGLGWHENIKQVSLLLSGLPCCFDTELQDLFGIFLRQWKAFSGPKNYNLFWPEKIKFKMNSFL